MTQHGLIVMVFPPGRGVPRKLRPVAVALSLAANVTSRLLADGSVELTLLCESSIYADVLTVAELITTDFPGSVIATIPPEPDDARCIDCGAGVPVACLARALDDVGNTPRNLHRVGLVITCRECEPHLGDFDPLPLRQEEIRYEPLH